MAIWIDIARGEAAHLAMMAAGRRARTIFATAYTSARLVEHGGALDNAQILGSRAMDVG